MHIVPNLSAPTLAPDVIEPANDGPLCLYQSIAMDGKVEQIQTGNVGGCPWDAPHEGRLHHSGRWVAALVTRDCAVCR
jgi:hypothetical protein